jgi:macrodomain Ter protein organizer (MatP/YcbG family)
VKQEEIYLVGNYPDERSAREEIGRYIETYSRSRPHQALFIFTPAHVHDVNNKSMLLRELNELKRRTRERRKAYWAERSSARQQPIEGDIQIRVMARSLILGHL